MPYPLLKEESYTNLGGINQKASKYLTGVNEALDIVNYDFSVVGSLTRRPGTTMYIGITVAGSVNSLYEFTRLSGFSQIIATANTTGYAISGSAINPFISSLQNNSIFSFVTFVDRLFGTDGNTFFRYDGANTYSYSLPPGTTPSVTGNGSGGGITGTFSYAYGYLNERGYLGPAINPQQFSAAGNTQVVLTGFTTPQGYGITAIAVYRTGPNLTTLFLLGYIPPGSTQYIDTGATTMNTIAPTYLWFTMAPYNIDIFNNQLFLMGFSSAPSTFYYSDIGEPEGIQPTDFDEIRTNDGDYLSAGINYLGTYMLFKRKSYFQLTGTDPTNFQVTQVSNVYGCLSKRATTVFESFCWFLDSKGIAQFDGANTNIISQRMEPYFRTMNIDAALTQSIMVHVKDRNEVWTCIPTNGATINNLIVVFDYVANAWGRFTGLNPSSVGIARGSFVEYTPFLGTYAGQINYMGASLFADNGNAITTAVTFPYKSNMERTTEHLWRRLWVDLDPIFGLTATMLVNLYNNQGGTAAISTTMIVAQYQNRIDFGISSRDLSLQLINSETNPLRLNGFTFAHRFQRNV